MPHAGTAPAAAVDAVPAVAGEAPARMVLRRAGLPAPAGEFAVLEGRRFALLGGAGPVPEALAARLGTHGAQAVVLPPHHQLADEDGPLDGVFHLEALARDGGGPLLPDSFPVFRAALRRGPRWLIAAAPAAGADVPAATVGRADGLRGLFRTVAREYPDVLVRLVEAAPEMTADEVAAALVGELTAEEPVPVVLRSPDGGRSGLEPVAAGALGALGGRGAGPAGDGAAEAAAAGLDRDAVVLLIGGARGITARFAATLAAASRCRIELAGRTALPDAPEDEGHPAGTGPGGAARRAGRAGRTLPGRHRTGGLADPGPAGDPPHPRHAAGPGQPGALPRGGRPGPRRGATPGGGRPCRARPAGRRGVRGRGDRGPGPGGEGTRLLPPGVRHQGRRCAHPARSAGRTAAGPPVRRVLRAASRPSSATAARRTTRRPTTPWSPWAAGGRPGPLPDADGALGAVGAGPGSTPAW
ncbi:hypothetical protein GCM10020221_03010 [Streptomyces thioluteus]|uniref:Polyketide synthase n=1 Tax=Streptomyces thioluteus TaxID=66431 RepID=A0ABP6IV13_STRTU